MTSPFTPWFERTCGSWTSHRRYLYASKDARPAEQSITTDFDITKVETGFAISWKSSAGEGVMVVRPQGSELFRDSGYYTDEPTTSCLTLVDQDTVAFHTAYGGTRYREEIRLLENDTIRLRQTIGFNEATGEWRLCGQYTEFRK